MTKLDRREPNITEPIDDEHLMNAERIIIRNSLKRAGLTVAVGDYKGDHWFECFAEEKDAELLEKLIRNPPRILDLDGHGVYASHHLLNFWCRWNVYL